MSEHEHICCKCSHVWPCKGVGRSKICQVDKAAKINKDGPYCNLCQCLEMAARYARHRKWDAVAEIIEKAQAEAGP